MKVNHGPFIINPIQLVTTRSMKQYGDNQWLKSISARLEFAKLRVTAYGGPLVILAKGREGIIFTWSQLKIGWSKNSFNTPVGFTFLLDKMHGTR